VKQKILIADDHPIFRGGIKEIVKGLNYLELVGEAGDGLEAYRLILSKKPDIAILDLEMPKLTGLDVCKKVLNEKHQVKIIMLTMHKEKHFFDEAMQEGVMGYILKDHAADELKTCLEKVSDGKKYVSAEIEKYLTVQQQSQVEVEDIRALKALLTPTERVVIKLISEGNQSQDIAEQLFVSVHTIDNHRANIIKKLKLEGKNSLLMFAMKHKGAF
jgi:DNA-binding NarL/FixJ family response regulator